MHGATSILIDSYAGILTPVQSLHPFADSDAKHDKLTAANY